MCVCILYIYKHEINDALILHEVFPDNLLHTYIHTHTHTHTSSGCQQYPKRRGHPSLNGVKCVKRFDTYTHTHMQTHL